MSQEKVSLHQTAIAMSERQHAGAVEERIAAINVFAGFVGDNFDLAVALLKGEKFDLVVQKATELGVSRVVPVVTKLADIRLRDDSDAAKRVARWRRIALEAAKQCGRGVVPAIAEPASFANVIQAAAGGPEFSCLLFSERDGQSLRGATQLLPAKATELTALVGSEGGWTDEELLNARQAGWTIVTLGGRTLRAETAAIAVAVLLQHLAGDLV